MPIVINEAAITRIDFFPPGNNGFSGESAVVEIVLKGPTVEGSILKLAMPWNRDFRDLSILIDSQVRAMGTDLTKVNGLPPQIA